MLQAVLRGGRIDLHPADRICDEPGVSGRAETVMMVVVVAAARPVLVRMPVTGVVTAHACRPGLGRVAGPRCSGDREGGVSHDGKVKDHQLPNGDALGDALTFPQWESPS